MVALSIGNLPGSLLSHLSDVVLLVFLPVESDCPSITSTVARNAAYHPAIVLSSSDTPGVQTANCWPRLSKDCPW